MNKDEILKLLKDNNLNYILDNDLCVKFHGFGLGDLLYSIISLENKIISSPINISINFFLNQCYDENEKKIEWNENLEKALEFRLKLISDICNHNENIKKSDFCFIYNENDIVYTNQFKLDIDYSLIKNYKIENENNFFCKSISNIDDEYVIFHTKIRLNSSYDYNMIKKNLKNLFSSLKIKKSKKIYLLGERNFKKNYEGNVHNIQTIYDELLELNKNNEVIDLTLDEIYNSLNYDNYKKDISLINKAKWNIIIGHGGHLTSSLLFGKTIFFSPLDEKFFYNNINLYNSGHRYFKRLEKLCEYLLLEL
jgi:hypothetical protein